MDYSTENWDKLVSLFSSLYDLIAGFLSQFTLFELIVLGCLVYIILAIGHTALFIEERLNKTIWRNFDYIEQINFNVNAIKYELDFLARHEDMEQLQVEVDELKNMIEQARDQNKKIIALILTNSG